MRKIFQASFWQNINLPLLVFLIFFLNVKFVVKIPALLFIMIYSKNLRLGLSWKNSRLPIFYAAIIVIELIKYVLITKNYSVNYAVVFSMGILQWIMSLLAIHYIKLLVERDEPIRIHNSIKVFFLLNFLISFFFLMILIFHPGWLVFWGHGTDLTFTHASAGDAILGITFDASTVNATLNCVGLIYFLHKKEYAFCYLNLATILICTSNMCFLLTMLILIVMICTVRTKELRLRSILCVIILVVLYFPFSPKNREYIRNYFVGMYVANKEPSMEVDTQSYTIRIGDSIITIKNAIRRRSSNPDSIYSFSNKKFIEALKNLFSLNGIVENDTTGYLTIYQDVYDSKPGKLIAFIQTYFYLKHSPKHLLFGSGIGNFSSKLAFRASGVNTLGSFPKKYRYASQDFQHNHLFNFIYYYNAGAAKHSVLNYPFSVYNQILGEYGLIGFLFFIVFYMWYFVSRYRILTYGKYLIFILLAFFLMEYWFEFFSLVILFELLMLMDMKGKVLALDTRDKISGSSHPIRC